MVALKDFISIIDDVDEALEILNVEGCDDEVQFKRGNTQYDNKNNVSYKSIYCSKWKWKKAKTIANDALKEATQKDSLSNLTKEEKNKSKNMMMIVEYITNLPILEIINTNMHHHVRFIHISYT